MTNDERRACAICIIIVLVVICVFGKYLPRTETFENSDSLYIMDDEWYDNVHYTDSVYKSIDGWYVTIKHREYSPKYVMIMSDTREKFDELVAMVNSSDDMQSIFKSSEDAERLKLPDFGSTNFRFANFNVAKSDEMSFHVNYGRYHSGQFDCIYCGTDDAMRHVTIRMYHHYETPYILASFNSDGREVEFKEFFLPSSHFLSM